MITRRENTQTINHRRAVAVVIERKSFFSVSLIHRDGGMSVGIYVCTSYAGFTWYLSINIIIGCDGVNVNIYT